MFDIILQFRPYSRSQVWPSTSLRSQQLGRLLAVEALQPIDLLDLKKSSAQP